MQTGLDGKGLIIRGLHRVSVDPPSTGYSSLRSMAADSLFKPVLSYASNTLSTAAAWIGAGNKATFTGLAAQLPANVHIVTAHSLGPSTVLLRVAHMYAVNEDAALSQPVSVSLATLFKGLTLLSAQEMTLPGTLPLTSAPQTTYMTTDGQTVSLPVIPPAPTGPGLTITLGPMQIRTFLCQVQYSS